jgi:hypothetical protein
MGLSWGDTACYDTTGRRQEPAGLCPMNRRECVPVERRVTPDYTNSSLSRHRRVDCSMKLLQLQSEQRGSIAIQGRNQRGPTPTSRPTVRRACPPHTAGVLNPHGLADDWSRLFGRRMPLAVRLGVACNPFRATAGANGGDMKVMVLRKHVRFPNRQLGA